MSEAEGTPAAPRSIGKLAAALAAAQADIKNPQRNREVTVQTKTGGKYKFKYATLDAIIDCVRGPLTKNGLWFTQTMATNIDGRLCLITTLMHSSGEITSSIVPLNANGSNQELGSELTFKKRYSLTALLGVAADEDDDGNIADGNTIAPPPIPMRVEEAKTATQAVVVNDGTPRGMFNVCCQSIGETINVKYPAMKQRAWKAVQRQFEYKTPDEMTLEQTVEVCQMLWCEFAPERSPEPAPAAKE